MCPDHNRTLPQTRGDTSPPKRKKTMLPARAEQTVSAAAVFMNQYKKRKKANATRQANAGGSRVELDDADGTTLETRTKPGSQLDETASLEINKTLQNALRTVYERTLPAIVPNNSQQDLHVSPLAPPASAEYKHSATQPQPPPISQFILSLRHTTRGGRIIRFEQTLEERMQNYKKLIVAQKDKLAALQKEWEAVVSEICKLGTVCLGEETMNKLLFTTPRFTEPLQRPYVPPSSPPKSTDAESTLFIPEQDSSPLAKKSRPCKKRVAFLVEDESEVHEEFVATSTSEFPEYIHRALKYQEHDLPTVPNLPEDEIKELNRRIGELGRKEVEALQKMNEDHQVFWEKKKRARLAGVQKEK